jgi:CRP-like cAMP-binding protein
MSTNQPPDHQSKNRILAALPAADYARIASHLETVHMKQGELLYRTNRRIEHVYFPHRSMTSVVTTTSDGAAIEVGVIGREGMAGLSVVLGVNASPADMMVQLPDSAERLAAAMLYEEFQRGGALQNLLLRYAHATLVMVAQTAACNRLHHIAERLARWLLMCRDRVVSDELPLTHEFLAMMLGIRRAGVTETALTLQAEGLITYKRGHITITDEAGLEAFACECYGIVRAEFERLFETPPM